MQGDSVMLIVAPHTMLNNFTSSRMSADTSPGCFRLTLTGFDGSKIETVYRSSNEASAALHEIINAQLDDKKIYFIQKKKSR